MSNRTRYPRKILIMPSFDVPKALAELQVKSLEDIETETAFTWASRALASLQNYRATGDVRWLLMWQTFGDEAIEHAAFAPAGILETIKGALS